MSDLFEAVEKTKQGANWRDTILLEHEGEELEFCIRQMKDPEFLRVMDQIDRNEIEDLQDELPGDLMDEYDELQEKSKEERSDSDSERLSELQEEIEAQSPDVLEHLSVSTFNGVREASKIAVEPDEDDMQRALREHAHEIEEETGENVRKPEDTRDYLNDRIAFMIDESTDFLSFVLGMECLMATADDEGN